jgi:hypothetical protein
MNDKKQVIRNGLAVVGIIGLVHVCVPGGWGWILTPFRRAAVAGGAWAESLVAVPVWLLCFLWALILTALGAVLLVMVSRRRKLDVELPAITKAEIFGLRWRWNYREGAITDLVSYCPKCEREVIARSETRHGFLHLISYACECRKWRSKSFHCSQEQMNERVCQAIREKISAQPIAADRRRCAAS